MTENWILLNRKTGRNRHFASFEKAREATTRAAAKYGVRFVSMRPKK